MPAAIQPSSANPTAARKFFAPRRLGHANLWVEDLARSEKFYNRVCGLTVEFWEPDLKATFLGTGHTPHDLGMIEITDGKARYGRNGLLQIPAGIGTQVGLNHLAWELENEVTLVEAHGKAKAAGVPMIMTVDHQVAHSVYMPDPDGNVIEFYCDTVKDWRRVLHGEMALITSEWTPGQSEPFSDSRYDTNPEIRTVAAAPVHPRRVSHAVLVTTDLPRLVDYYTTVGGMDVVHSAAGGEVVYLRGGESSYRCHLVICAGDTCGYHHVAFELENAAAVDEAEARLRRQGIAIEKKIDNEAKRGFFLIDPDGLRSEYLACRKPGYPDLAAADARERPYLT